MRILIVSVAVALLCSACLLPKRGVVAGHGSPPQHSIRVMLLDADSNKPRKRVRVGLITADKTGIVPTANTNSKGVAVFALRDPLPDRVELGFAPYDFGLCSDAWFRTDDILKQGIVSTDTCKKSGPEYLGKPTPGELIVFGKKVRVWGWMLQEIP
jgi:hypothetical protein